MAMSYMNSVAHILERGQFTNSYKFALLRSLAAFGMKSGKGETVVKTEQLAENFVKLFWPLTLRFNIRQATVPDKEPVVMRYIRDEASALDLSPETPLRDFQKNYSNLYSKLVLKVSKNAFGNVIPRFHTVGRGRVTPLLYEASNEGILISANSRGFLQQNHKALDLLAIGSWVKFTEKFTSAPRLYEKIQGLAFKRSALKPYREFFQSVLGETECFYCGGSILPQPHVEHVVPWSFVAEDKVWNLVLSCKDCNFKKSSQTPTNSFITKLVRRNEKILSLDASVIPSRINKDLSEWRPGELKKHIEVTVSRCRSDGFGTWSNR
jgi:5-methylcytosine-specific restriction endonuclease McrA